MGIFEVTIRQKNVRREGGHVKGTLEIEVKDPDFKHTQDFDYVGEVKLIDGDVGVAHLLVVIKEDGGQSCVTGSIEVKVLGIGTKKDFDKNCEPIREAAPA